MMLLHILLIFFSLEVWRLCESRKLSLEDTMIFGPGINPDIVLPARYFYIQAVDTKGKNFTGSPGKDTFSVDFKSKDDRVRVWRDILDRNDGSFIVRYRLYQSYEDIHITVKHNGKHVSNSPYHLMGISYHEQCYCPETDATKWASYMSCPLSYKQVDSDFKTFPKLDLKHMKAEGIKRFGKYHAMCHYSVIDNQVYRKCYGEHVGFAQFIDAWLLSIARKILLPDIEILFNLGDWPLSEKGKEPIPVISWSGSDSSYDIVIPTYDLTESVLETLGRVSLDMMSVQGNTGPKWKKKIEKGLFRGRDSRQERLDLTVLGRSKPHLFDVGLTNFFFFEYDESKYGPKNQHISFYDFFKYKYQLNVDGTVAAYRFPYLLVGDAVVFKQDSPYYEHFYKELEPMKHYIPFKRDLSDLEEKLLWAKSHDKEARNISFNGQQYARDNLMGDKLYCYTYKVFEEYSKRQIQTPAVHEEMEHIKQPSGSDSHCDCRRKHVLKKDKSKKKKFAKNASKKSAIHEEL